MNAQPSELKVAAIPNRSLSPVFADYHHVVEIADLFQKAHQTHIDSIRYLIECGERLQAKRASLKHGEWLPWLHQNTGLLGFGARTAQLLMKAADSNTKSTSYLAKPDEVLKLNRKIWGNAQARKSLPSSEKRIDLTGINVPERSAQVPVNDSGQGLAGTNVPVSDTTTVDIEDERWIPDVDEDAQLAAFEKEYAASIDKVMDADDKLSAARDEIKRQASEITVLKISRDGYQNQGSEVVRRLKGLQRKNDRMQAEIDELIAENESLRERIAIMEEA